MNPLDNFTSELILMRILHIAELVLAEEAKSPAASPRQWRKNTKSSIRYTVRARQSASKRSR